MMTTLPSATEGARRRIVLIDFDWQDADLLPSLLQKPGVVVRLVAGERTEDAGLRMAEVCGLPRTLDLADLTREIFDVALVSDRSQRRQRVQSLLEALRTPCYSPAEFLESGAQQPAPPVETGEPAIRAAATAVRERAAAPAPEPAPPEPAETAPASGPPEAAETPARTLDRAPAATPPGTPARAPAATPVEAPEKAPAGAQAELPAPAAAGDDFDSVVERALTGMEGAITTVRPRRGEERRSSRSLQNLHNFPSPEDRAALESALQQLVANTGAGSAELHAGRASLMKLIAQVGAQDPLLQGMVDMALQLNSPQIIKGLTSPNEGRLWGAWPFRTIQHRGVLAASSIDPAGGVSSWEKMVDEMRQTWDQKDRESAAQSFPMLHDQERAWLGRPDFRARLDLAVERNKFDGLEFTLHRLEFPGPEAAVERMCQGLPQLLRGSDYLCRVPPRHVLLLTAVAADDYTHVRRRLLAAWEQAWRDSGQTPPAPPIVDLRAEIAGPEDAEGFIGSAEGWFASSS